MSSLPRTALDRAGVILERERPFFSLGALSMYTLALIAEAPVIIARFLLALLVAYAVLFLAHRAHPPPNGATHRPSQGQAPDNLRYGARGDDVARTTNKGETR
jgi:hypothetical protein